MVSARTVLLGVAAIVLPAGAIGYLVTTFLFAFSGGQYRMVAIVNAVAIAVVVAGAVTAAVSWARRARNLALKRSAIATGVGWLLALVVEWMLSFQLGA